MFRVAILASVLSSVLLLAAQSTPAEGMLLSGTRFVEAMKDNTVSGMTADGTPYNIYFVEGGQATFTDALGRHDSGRWHIDARGGVCLQWSIPTTPQNGCFRVNVDGRHMTWTSQGGDVNAALRGSVTSAYLQPRPPAAVALPQ